MTPTLCEGFMATSLLGPVPTILLALLGIVWTVILVTRQPVERLWIRLVAVVELVLVTSMCLGCDREAGANSGFGGRVGAWLAAHVADKPAVSALIVTLLVIAGLMSIPLATDWGFLRLILRFRAARALADETVRGHVGDYTVVGGFSHDTSGGVATATAPAKTEQSESDDAPSGEPESLSRATHETHDAPIHVESDASESDDTDETDESDDEFNRPSEPPRAFAPLPTSEEEPVAEADDEFADDDDEEEDEEIRVDRDEAEEVARSPVAAAEPPKPSSSAPRADDETAPGPPADEGIPWYMRPRGRNRPAPESRPEESITPALARRTPPPHAAPSSTPVDDKPRAQAAPAIAESRFDAQLVPDAPPIREIEIAPEIEPAPEPEPIAPEILMAPSAPPAAPEVRPREAELRAPLPLTESEPLPEPEVAETPAAIAPVQSAAAHETATPVEFDEEDDLEDDADSLEAESEAELAADTATEEETSEDEADEDAVTEDETSDDAEEEEAEEQEAEEEEEQEEEAEEEEEGEAEFGADEEPELDQEEAETRETESEVELAAETDATDSTETESEPEPKLQSLPQSEVGNAFDALFGTSEPAVETTPAPRVERAAEPEPEPVIESAPEPVAAPEPAPEPAPVEAAAPAPVKPVEDDSRISADDKLYLKAGDLVMDAQKASISFLQRQLGIGYFQAAKLLDRLEKEKIIGPYTGSVNRALLCGKSDWDSRRARILHS